MLDISIKQRKFKTVVIIVCEHITIYLYAHEKPFVHRSSGFKFKTIFIFTVFVITLRSDTIRFWLHIYILFFHSYIKYMKHFIATSILVIANKTSTEKTQWFSYERFLFVGSHSLVIISQQPAACQLFFICYWYIPACQNRYLTFSQSTTSIEHQGIVLGQRDSRTGHWHKAGLNNQTKHVSDQKTC